MFNARRRRQAWMLLLVLALELALLCCAYAHASDHICANHEHCALCAWLRDAARGRRATALAALALLALCAVALRACVRSRRARGESLIQLKVRLND